MWIVNVFWLLLHDFAFIFYCCVLFMLYNITSSIMIFNYRLVLEARNQDLVMDVMVLLGSNHHKVSASEITKNSMLLIQKTMPLERYLWGSEWLLANICWIKPLGIARVQHKILLAKQLEVVTFQIRYM